MYEDKKNGIRGILSRMVVYSGLKKKLLKTTFGITLPLMALMLLEIMNVLISDLGRV